MVKLIWYLLNQANLTMHKTKSETIYTAKSETFLFDQILKKWDVFLLIKLFWGKTFNQDFKLPHKKKLIK